MNYYYSGIIFWTKVTFHFCDKTDIIASAASAPFFFLAFACFIFKQVKIPLPIGFFEFIDKFISASVEAFEIKSKWCVSPFITQPKATIASNFFKFFEIVTGISKTPGTLIIFTLEFFDIFFNALDIKSLDISL